MDQQQAMAYFRRIVETGSMAAAARDLGCSRSVVSKHLAWLEQWTSSRLLARTTRSLQLTDAGKRFYEYCRRVEEETEQMLASMSQRKNEVSGRLVIGAPLSLTLTALSAPLAAFQRAHPGITLDVRLGDSISDLIRDGVDVALRARADLEDSTLVATSLATIERVVCASPAYWREHGMPATPEDLHRHNCLTYLLGSDAQAWEFASEGKTFRAAVSGRMCSDNTLLIIQFMLEGAGVGLVPEVMVQPQLRSGALVRALSGYRAVPRTLYAVYPTRKHLPQKVSAFIGFMRERLGAGTA